MIEAAEADGRAQARRHHRRGDRRQYRARARPGRRPQGLSHAAGRARQDGAREDPARARPWAPRSSSRAPTSARAIPTTIRTSPRRSRAARPARFFVNQFANPANPRAHETTTGPEILRQMDGDVDAVVVGVGSGGTLTGIGRFMRQASPKTAMILADPEGSMLAPYVADRQDGRGRELGGRRHRRGFRAAQCRPVAGVRGLSRSPTRRASLPRASCLRAEGILAGSSSGTLLAAALRYCRAQTTPKRVVSLVCDSGAKYLSKVFNPTFLAQEGWTHPERHGTVRDVVTQPLQRRHRRRRAAAGQSAHGLRAHALGRCLAAAGARRERTRGRPGRRKRRARGAADRCRTAPTRRSRGRSRT